MVARAGAFPAVFYVNSCDLLEQAHDRFRKYVYRNGMPAEIGRVGNGHCDVRPITIATVQSCQRTLKGKYVKNSDDDYSPDDKTKFTEAQAREVRAMVHDAQFVYVDECHHVSCQTIQDIMNASHRARLRYGGSASPWRDDGLDILIEACFGRRACDISASFLIKRGYLVKPYITFNHFTRKMGPAKDWNSHYKAYVVNNDYRNEWIAERARLHMSHGRPTIVLVKWSQHAEIIKELLPEAEVLTSTGKHKRSPKRRKEILDGMRSRETMAIIGTTLLDEGVDVPAASAGIFAGGGKSSTRELQRIGRLMRRDDEIGKDRAWIEEFHDHDGMKWLEHQARKRRKILNTEREFEVGDKRIDQ
jgi:superfamily II DNA or RNA helicase